MFNDEKWNAIHGPLKSMVKTLIVGASYVMNGNVIKNKESVKHKEILLLWECWDDAFDKWEKALGKRYTDTETYRILETGRNMAFTIIDNDSAYIKLVRQFIRSWEDAKDRNV